MSITRLSGGLTPADGSDPRTFPAIFNDVADTVESQGSAITGAESDIDALEANSIPTDVTSPVAGDKLVFDGTNFVNLEAYAFVETVYFTSNGTFSKGDYAWLRAVRVKCQGGGGGGGGSAGISNRQCGAGGGGGGYAESFITDIVGLASSVTVTRGAGGAGGVGDVDGSPGGASSFGSLVVGNGGNKAFGNGGRSAGVASGGSGDSVFVGGAGHQVDFLNLNPGGNGGGSFLGQGGKGRDLVTLGPGSFGSNFGGGGGGCHASSGGPQNGGDGADGIVIVELFA